MKAKSDAYTQLICIMQRVHFQVRVAVFSCQDNIYFIVSDIVVKKQMWSSVVCTLVDDDTRHYVVKMLCNKLSYITMRALCFRF